MFLQTAHGVCALLRMHFLFIGISNIVLEAQVLANSIVVATDELIATSKAFSLEACLEITALGTTQESIQAVMYVSTGN